MFNKSIFVLFMFLICFQSHAEERGSEKAELAFQKAHPCPANGKKEGQCPGYVIDHIKPLSCRGPDEPSNMQWQTIGESAAKDKWELKGC